MYKDMEKKNTETKSKTDNKEKYITIDISIDKTYMADSSLKSRQTNK